MLRELLYLLAIAKQLPLIELGTDRPLQASDGIGFRKVIEPLEGL